MHLEAGLAIGLQSFGRHDGAEVRAADADVHHIGDGFPRVTLPGAAADRVAELAHLLQHAVHLGHHVLAVDLDGPVRTIAQSDVEDGAILGDVDPVAGHQPLRPPLEIRLRGQIDEQAHGLRGDAVLGVVEKDVLETKGELRETIGVVREHLAHEPGRHLLVMGEKSLPGFGASHGRHA